MSVVIDFEGFQTHARFYVKELAAHAIDDPSFRGRWLFKPSFEFERLDKKTQLAFTWVSHNLHYLNWVEGDLPYSDLKSVLRVLFGSFKKFYVKGLQKKNFIQRLTSKEVIDLEELDCPKFCDLPPVEEYCPYWHMKNFPHCAVQKAAAYARFVENI